MTDDEAIAQAFRALPIEQQNDVAYVASYFEGWWGQLQHESDRKVLYRFITMASQDEAFTKLFQEHMEWRWAEAEETTERTIEAWGREEFDSAPNRRRSLKAEIAFRDFHYNFPYPPEPCSYVHESGDRCVLPEHEGPEHDLGYAE